SDLTIASNWGVYGIPIKLGKLGVPGMTTRAAALASWLYTVPLLGAVVVGARRERPAEEQPLVWLAALVLASLRSPLAPNVYVGAPALWLLALIAIEARQSARRIACLAGAWIAVGGLPPLPTPRAT